MFDSTHRALSIMDLISVMRPVRSFVKIFKFVFLVHSSRSSFLHLLRNSADIFLVLLHSIPSSTFIIFIFVHLPGSNALVCCGIRSAIP